MNLPVIVISVAYVGTFIFLLLVMYKIHRINIYGDARHETGNNMAADDPDKEHIEPRD